MIVKGWLILGGIEARASIGSLPYGGYHTMLPNAQNYESGTYIMWQPSTTMLQQLTCVVVETELE